MHHERLGLLPPALAGRYEPGALLGRGGSASVHEAWDRALERAVAVKVVPADPARPAMDRRRTEARLLASVDHPCLVTLHDAVVEEDATYLVMELVEGGSLQGRLERSALDADAAFAVAADVASALAHIHGRGIVHRDVKPANILLADGGPGEPPVGKLSDFGIAGLLDGSTTTVSGIVGTARYLSPEQARGHRAGAASDVYSLGLTLLEALTGRPAFPGDVAASLLARLLRDPEVPTTLGYTARSLLTAMVSRDPAARPTAAEVVRRARAARAEASGRGSVLDLAETAPIVLPVLPAVASGASVTTAPIPVTAPVAVRHPGRRRRVVALAVTAVLVGGATAVGLPLLPTGTDPASSVGGPGAAVAAAETTPTPAPTTPAAAPTADARPAIARSSTGTAPAGSTDDGSRTGSSRSAATRHGTTKASSGSAKGHAKAKTAKAKTAKPKKAKAGGSGKASGSAKHASKSGGKGKGKG